MTKDIQSGNGFKMNGEIGGKPKQTMMRVDQLLVDHSYQRTLLTDHTVLRIAKNFNWTAFGSISVMKRGDKFYVTDGQHRLEAVKLRGDIEMVPCVIHESGGLESEAKAFVGLNTKRKVVCAIDKYRAMLVAGEPEICEVNKKLTKEGFTVGTGDTCNTVSFVSCLLYTWRLDKDLAIASLIMQREIMIRNDEEHKGLDNRVHKGVFLIGSRINVPLLSLVQKFNRFPQAKYIAQIKLAQIEYGAETHTAYRAGVLKCVNSGLRNRIVLNEEEA